MKLVNPRLPACLTLIVLLTQPFCTLHAKDDGILERFGTLIERAIGNDVREHDGEATFMDENPRQNLPGERDIEEYKARLQLYSLALQNWLAVTGQLSDEQQVALQKLFDEEVVNSTESFSETPVAEGQQQIFPATFPMLFTVMGTNRSGSSTAVDFSQQILQSIRGGLLNPEQQERIDVALKERSEFHHEAFVEYLVAQVDEELFLTAEQRQNIIRILAERTPSISHPLYMFNAQSYYLPYESMSTIFSNAASGKILDTNQKKRMQDLNNTDPNSQHIIFQSSAGRDSWYTQMNEAGLKERKKFLNAAAVRVAYFQKELSLSAEQTEFLTSASKGAAVRAVNDWKESTEQVFESMEQQMAQMGGDFGFGASNMDVRSIENNEIWTDALKTITKEPAKNVTLLRKKAHQNATANSVLALLDHELWLLPEQRTRLQPLVEKSMPKSSDPFQYQEYIREVILIAYPLFRTPEKASNEILHKPQQGVWKQLQSSFRHQKENNYVEVQLRNNGASFGFSLAH